SSGDGQRTAGATVRPRPPPWSPAPDLRSIHRRVQAPSGAVAAHAEEAPMTVSIPEAPQRFVVSHLDEGDFKTGGLRDYSAYRDLGVAAATGGLAVAHVIRMVVPFRPELSVRHHHEVRFQMVYCLKGWFQTDFEGVGPQRLEAGSCWVQPAGIRHTVV